MAKNNLTFIDWIKEKAGCQICKRGEYCKRIPVNKIIVEHIRKYGICPDFEDDVGLNEEI